MIRASVALGVDIRDEVCRGTKYVVEVIVYR